MFKKMKIENAMKTIISNKDRKYSLLEHIDYNLLQ